MRRTALVVHVDRYAGSAVDEEGEPSPWRLRDLPFAAEVDRVRDVLRQYGYDVESPPGTTAAEIGRAVADIVDRHGPGDTVIIYVLSHGERDPRTNAQYVIGSDGMRRSVADATHWLERLAGSADGVPATERPYTLFLFDMCYAGQAMAGDWRMRTLHDPGKVFALFAALDREKAYNARFTVALHRVLTGIRANPAEHGLAAGMRYVPLRTVAQLIHAEVERLAGTDAADPQIVIGTPISLGIDDANLPFFPAPRPPVDGPSAVRGAAGSPWSAGDDGADLRHFVAAASGGVNDGTDLSCPSRLVGRRDQLKMLSAWLCGAAPSLRVVTGRAGVGKSALLGYLVCRAHPALRPATADMFPDHLDGPAEVPDLAVVHLRERTVDDVVAELARQLGQPRGGRPEAFVRAVRASPRSPTLILDALDEAIDPGAIVADLIDPLAAAVGGASGGRPACRVLIATGPCPAAEPLLGLAARGADGIVDLDDVPREVVRAELADYVGLLVAALHHGEPGAPRVPWAAFAQGVADRLAAPDRPPGTWGEYLVAGLYTRSILQAGDLPVDHAGARLLGERAPRELEDVFDLDIRARTRRAPWLRPTLVALAHARGAGMPLPVARSVAIECAAAGTAAPVPTIAEVDDLLRGVGGYLTATTDPDGYWCYRLRHEACAQLLRRGASARAVYAGVLRLVVAPDRRQDWKLATHHVREHVLDYAFAAGTAAELLANPAFLLELTPAIHAAADRRDAEPAVAPYLALAALNAALPADSGPLVRRAALAVEALRVGAGGFAGSLATMPGEPPLVWRPRWIFGTPSSVLTPDPPPAGGSGAGTAGAMVVTANRYMGVAAHDAATGAPLFRHAMRHDAVRTVAVTQEGTDPVIITAGDDGVRVWRSGGRAGGHEIIRAGPVHHVAVLNWRGAPLVASASSNGVLRTWRLDGERCGEPVAWGEPVRHLLLTEAAGRPLAVVLLKHGVPAVWDLESQTAVQWKYATEERATAVAVAEQGARRFVVVADRAGQVQCFALPDGQRSGAARLPGAATHLVAVAVEGNLFVVAAVNRQLHRWDLHRPGSPSQVAPLASFDASITALTTVTIRGRRHVLAAGTDGSVTAVDPATGALPVSFRSPRAVTALAAGPWRGPGGAGAVPAIRHPATAATVAAGRLVVAAAADVPGARAENPPVRQERAEPARLAVALVPPSDPTAVTVDLGPVLPGSLGWTRAGARLLFRYAEAAGRVRFWDALSGAAVTAPERLNDYPAAAVLPDRGTGAPDGVVALVDDRVVIVRVEADGGLVARQSGADPVVLAGPQEQIAVVAAVPGPDPALVVTGGRDATLRLFSLRDGRQLDRVDAVGPVHELRLLGGPPDPVWAVVSAGGEVVVYEVSLQESGVTA
jgi:hypothetical protein